MAEKCFCHLNGYKVKDADARKMLSGEMPMGDIKVKSIRCKNLLKIPNGVTVSNGITTTVSSGLISIKGTATAGWFNIALKQKIILKPGRYTFSSNKLLSQFGLDLYNGEVYGFSIVKGKESNTFTLNEELTITRIVGVTTSGETIDIEDLTFQLEEGSIATEHTPYFELATKEDSCVEYHLELPLGSIIHGDTFTYNNELSSECVSILDVFFKNKLLVDNAKNPRLIIHNSNATENSTPTTLILTNVNAMTLPVDNEDGTRTLGSYTFIGHDEMKGVLEYGTNLEHSNYYVLSINFDVVNDEYEVKNCYLQASSHSLATQKYVDSLASGGSNGTSNCGIYVIETSNMTNLSSQSEKIGAILKETIGKGLQPPTLLIKYNGTSSSIDKELLFTVRHYSTGLIEYINSYTPYSPAGNNIIKRNNLKIQYTESNGEYTVSYAKTETLSDINVLTTGNTNSYTPTKDYHPATKKYVDDLIAGLRTELSS